MAENPTPEAWSRWTHRELSGDYTFLTVAEGIGQDCGVDYAYGLRLDTTTGLLSAFVCRMDSWHDVMKPHPTHENVYERTLREIEEEASGGLDDFDLDPDDLGLDFDLEL